MRTQTLVMLAVTISSATLLVSLVINEIADALKDWREARKEFHAETTCLFCNAEKAIGRLRPDIRSETVDRGQAALDIMRGGL